MEEEINKLRAECETFATVDPATGLANRAGVIDALERADRWLQRRGDVYGLLLVELPDLGTIGDADAVRHIGATIGAGVREVDEVGRLDDTTFSVVLFDPAPGTVKLVADRVREILRVALRRFRASPFRVAGVEVTAREVTAEHLIKTARRLLESTAWGSYKTMLWTPEGRNEQP